MPKRLGVLFCCIVLFAALPVTAGQWDKSTTITFSGPVELPGIVLPAGTYLFKLADVPGDRHVVQVFNAEETHIYATILAIPNERLTATSETVIRFEERRRDAPEAIRAWFYPADNFGQEFVYPKRRGAELATAAQVPVKTAELKPAETPEELVNEPVETVMPERQEAEALPAPTEVEAPAVIAEAEPAPAVELPKTASPIPLLGLAGLCSLVLAGALRAFARAKA